LYPGMKPYFTTSVFAAVDPEYGPNICYHRAVPIGKKKMVARVCDRHTKAYLDRAGDLKVAIAMGLHPSVCIAAATSVEIGKNEYEIANYLHPLKVAHVNGVPVPSTAEVVITGTMTQELHEEGPFVDLTGTYDVKRMQPVIEVDKVYHRDGPIQDLIVPALPEHALLMGMPREPAIFNAVSRVAKCRDVFLPVGGCSWLHGFVSIKKRKDAEVPKVIDAAFGAHSSMKHLFVVDDDIDIYNSREVEWALATRCQSVKVFRGRGSSLDPSADIKSRSTNKVAFDCTIPEKADRKDFVRA